LKLKKKLAEWQQKATKTILLLDYHKIKGQTFTEIVSIAIIKASGNHELLRLITGFQAVYFFTNLILKQNPNAQIWLSGIYDPYGFDLWIRLSNSKIILVDVKGNFDDTPSITYNQTALSSKITKELTKFGVNPGDIYIVTLNGLKVAEKDPDAYLQKLSQSLSRNAPWLRE